MNSKAGVFFDAITLLREDIVEEAQDYRFRKARTSWRRFGSLAACLVLIASISLLMLPKGCGGSAPPPDNNAPAGSVDGCMPADAPSSEPAPEPAEPPLSGPENEYGDAGVVRLTATVLEVQEDFILVESLESESETQQFKVSTDGLELPELAEGDTVRITCSGPINPAHPAEILEPQSIELINNN